MCRRGYRRRNDAGMFTGRPFVSASYQGEADIVVDIVENYYS